MDKESIRNEMRLRRREVTEADRINSGRLISQNLLESNKISLLLSCWRISTYLSTPHEIPTRYITRGFWNAGREVCVPTWDEEKKTYILCAFPPGMTVVEGPLGIREPIHRMPVPIWDVDAFIIPGLAFDLYGARIGFGAGYYDRILSGARKTSTLIALCHDWQVIDHDQIPQEPHDIRMNWIVTESRVIKCGLPPVGRTDQHPEE